MVNQKATNIQTDLNRSLYIMMLNQLDEDIGRINLPEFIVNFNQFQRWPKRLFKRYITYDKYGTSAGIELPSQIGKKIQNALTKIYDRLSQLGQYGDLLKKKFSTEVEYFCPSLKKPNKLIEYSPSDIDKQLIKIVQYYQNQTGGKYKLSDQFENNIYLAELQETIKIFYDLKRKRKKSSQYIMKMDKENNFLLGPIFREGFVDRHCLRCTTHFLYGTTTNACHPGISFYPIHAYELISYQSFSQIENQVRASMCTMLNQPSGGIILLGCQRQGTSYIPKGLHITQKQKDSLQQKLQGYFIKIYPKVKRNQQIFIDFIPIMQVKQNTANKYSNELYNLQPLHGMYVCRIFMVPKMKFKVFLLKVSNEHSSLEARREKHDSTTINESQHYNFMIEKFENYYGAGAGAADKPDRNYCTQNHYNISCRQPAIGQYSFDKKSQENANNFQMYDPDQRPQRPAPTVQTGSSSQIIKPIKSVKDPDQRKPQDYKLWTLVVGDKSAIQKLLESANGQKQNKGIKIEQMYAQYKFKLTKTTWVMFHDQKFEVMKKLSERYSITYKTKELKMIAANVYLEVDEGLSAENLFNLQSWIKKIGCQIKDRVNKQVEGKRVIIFWFDLFKSSIFAYFYLADQNFKVRFIRGASHFKNSTAHSTVQVNSTQPGYNNYSYNYSDCPISQADPIALTEEKVQVQHQQQAAYQQNYYQYDPNQAYNYTQAGHYQQYDPNSYDPNQHYQYDPNQQHYTYEQQQYNYQIYYQQQAQNQGYWNYNGQSYYHPPPNN